MEEKEREALNMCYRNAQRHLTALKSYLDSNGSDKPLGIIEEDGIHIETIDTLYKNTNEWLELMFDYSKLF